MRASEELKNYVQKFQGGDKEAFEGIYKMSYSYLHTCVIHVVRDEETAQDVLQDVYMEMLKNLGQLRNPEDFLGWAAVIANRKCFALLKTRNRELLTYEGEGEQTELLETIADNEEFIPESFIQNKEKQRLVREIIDGLTDMQRLCVISFYYNQMSQEEIAQELGIPVNTVKSHLNRAKEKIKAAVIELDKEKGTRLYSLAPFMLLLLGAEAEACTVPAMSYGLAREAGLKSGNAGTAGEAGTQSGNTGTPGETGLQSGQADAIGNAAGNAAGKAMMGKLAAFVAVGLAVAAVITGMIVFNKNKDKDDIGHNVPKESVEPHPGTGMQDPDDLEQAQDSQETNQQQEPHAQELFVLDAAYESYGNAYGGVIPVKKDGLWGAVDYDNQVIVPYEYTGFFAAPDKLGNIVLTNSIFTEEIVDMSFFGGDPETVIQRESKEYYLFDRQGNLLYQGTDQVRASGGMYITLHYGDETATVDYHRLDGTVLFSYECDPSVAEINTFYEGISSVYSYLESDISVGTSDSDPMGQREGDASSRIGMVDLQGNVSWREDPTYHNSRSNDNNEQTADVDQSPVDDIYANATGSDTTVYIPRAILSTMNHGYYIRGSHYMVPGALDVYDDAADNRVAYIDYCNLSVDENGRVSIDERYYNEENAYRGFYVDGGYLWNYGAKMIFVIDGKSVLVDFARNTGNAKIQNTDEIVMAVYDYISMTDENYWLAQSGDQWGYIDHDGNEMAMFQDAGQFVGGYALVKEDGQVWMIDEEFRKLESLGQADSVSAMGELYSVKVGEERHIYQLY